MWQKEETNLCSLPGKVSQVFCKVILDSYTGRNLYLNVGMRSNKSNTEYRYLYTYPVTVRYSGSMNCFVFSFD